jgi:ubiquinol oxidase
VITVQGVFFNAYFLGYLISPKFAHRMVGYLEEEAIHSYTEFLKELDKGNIKNVPAPAIAIDYWRLPPNSTLRDVVEVVRADEAHHRDVNHFASVRIRLKLSIFIMIFQLRPFLLCID